MSHIQPTIGTRGARLMPLVIFLIALAVRLPGLGGFMTVDEENWMIRSSQYWHNLFVERDTGGAFMTTHPGATAMWLIGAGEVIQEQRLGFSVDQSNLRHFRLAATLPMALVTAALTAVIAWLARLLLGLKPAAGAGALLAVDPYLTGMSQIAHLDALLALLMLGAVLALLCDLKSPRLRYRLLSGIFTGLALGTKLLPALWLLVFFAFVLLARHGSGFHRSFPSFVRAGMFIFGVAIVTLYAVWPALWFTDDLSRSFERDVPNVITQAHGTEPESSGSADPALFYLWTVLGRSTPLTLFVTAGLVITAGRAAARRRKMNVPLWLLLYALGFLVLITWVAKKGDRYALPALGVLTFLSGYGLALALVLLQQRLRLSRAWQGSVVALALLLLMAHTLFWAPYAIAYNNPFFDVRHLSQQGWGEGLDAAAAWLNTHPLADQMMVASWYPGALAPYFKGLATSLSARDDNRVAFVVTYRNMGGRAQDDIASDVLDEFREAKPAHVVSIHGTPYAWIYNTIDVRYFTKHVGEITPGVEVGQTIPVTHDNWAALDVGLATFSSRHNTGTVVLSIRESVDAPDDVRTVSVSATEIADAAWHRFEFEPIPDSAGRTYYVALSSPDSVPGNAVTVKFSEHDLLPGELFVRRQPLAAGEVQSQFQRAGDMAYRLP